MEQTKNQIRLQRALEAENQKVDIRRLKKIDSLVSRAKDLVNAGDFNTISRPQAQTLQNDLDDVIKFIDGLINPVATETESTPTERFA